MSAEQGIVCSCIDNAVSNLWTKYIDKNKYICPF